MNYNYDFQYYGWPSNHQPPYGNALLYTGPVERQPSPALSTSSQTSGSGAEERREYDKWTKEQEAYLVAIWAENLDRLESQQSRKVWQDIANKINEKFHLKCSPAQIMRKLKHMKDKYKEAKDWNRRQTGGSYKTCPYYNQFDVVLGSRDSVTLQHVRESAFAANSDSSTSGLNGPQGSAETEVSESAGNDDDESEKERQELLLMGIKKAKSRTERKKSRGKGRKRKADLEEDEDSSFKQYAQRVEDQSQRLVTVVENMEKNQAEQTQTMQQFLGVMVKMMESQSNKE